MRSYTAVVRRKRQTGTYSVSGDTEWDAKTEAAAKFKRETGQDATPSQIVHEGCVSLRSKRDRRSR